MVSATPGWFVIAVVLFFAVDLVVVVGVIIAFRRRRTQRGFEVITKPDPGAGQEARKD